jgi:hypothetical protein
MLWRAEKRYRDERNYLKFFKKIYVQSAIKDFGDRNGLHS